MKKEFSATLEQGRITSVLERFTMCVLSADNGKDAIQALMDNPAIDIRPWLHR